MRHGRNVRYFASKNPGTCGAIPGPEVPRQPRPREATGHFRKNRLAMVRPWAWARRCFTPCEQTLADAAHSSSAWALSVARHGASGPGNFENDQARSESKFCRVAARIGQGDRHPDVCYANRKTTVEERMFDGRVCESGGEILQGGCTDGSDHLSLRISFVYNRHMV